jgi:coenzyme F420-reducing hydrogenase beta subunit
MQHFPDGFGRRPGRRLSPGDMVSSGLCVGCGACASMHDEARMEWDADGFLKPSGDASWYRGRRLSFGRTCPMSPVAPNEDSIAYREFPGAAQDDRAIGRFEGAYVGHAAQADYRAQGSSGGLVSWVAAQLLEGGAVDGIAHVVPTDPASGRLFEYRISRTTEELRRGAKSRYYPVELSAVLREVRAVEGRYAIVGVPCFIKAVRLLQRAEPLLRERIAYTLGIFCGHMKSRHMVESFAWQLGTELGSVQAIDYRLKDPSRPANWYRVQLELTDGSATAQDWWHLADGDWGAGFLQNPACDYCDDVVAETADIAFGDAWLEPYSSDGRGTNVVVVRSNSLHELIRRGIEQGQLSLKPVDAEFVQATQAAGLRHRRQGLAYRLTWRRRGVVPRKRVDPTSVLPLRRKLVYRLRFAIARQSHWVFRLARALNAPAIYIVWARAMLRLYQSVTWSRGGLGKLLDRFFPKPEL